MGGRLAEVARRVGVSEATVSRVLNGKPGASEATRAAVLKAVETMGYGPPAPGPASHGRLIGLVLPDLQNPIFPALAEVMAGALGHRGILPVLWTPTVAEVPAPGYTDLLLDYQVSGAILAGGMYSRADASRGHYQRLREKGLPVVVVNPTVAGLEFPRVATDDVSAVQQAYAHLAQLGHERIGLVVGPPQHLPSDRKAATFAQLTTGGTGAAAAGVSGPAVTTGAPAGAGGASAGVAVSGAGGASVDAPAAGAGVAVAGAAAAGPMPAGAPEIERVQFSMEDGRAAGDRLIERGVRAIICGSDILALGVVRAARRAGLRVPRDLSVVGYDDSALLSLADPALTTIRQPVEAIGRAVVALLIDQIDGLAVSTDELLFEPSLVVRASTAPPGPGRPGGGPTPPFWNEVAKADGEPDPIP